MQTVVAIIGGIVVLAALVGFVRSLLQGPKRGLSGGDVASAGYVAPLDHGDGGHAGGGGHGG